MAPPPKPNNFEEALARLEGIIKLMEANDLPLEEMLVRYEEGIDLVKFCGEKLDHAEQRIKIITENPQGKPELVDFDVAKVPENPPAASPAPRASKASKPTIPESGSADEVSLF